ncbi:MAG: hypothetical protein STSR0003_26100 [Smithella sp.]
MKSKIRGGNRKPLNKFIFSSKTRGIPDISCPVINFRYVALKNDEITINVVVITIITLKFSITLPVFIRAKHKPMPPRNHNSVLKSARMTGIDENPFIRRPWTERIAIKKKNKYTISNLINENIFLKLAIKIPIINNNTMSLEGIP